MIDPPVLFPDPRHIPGGHDLDQALHSAIVRDPALPIPDSRPPVPRRLFRRMKQYLTLNQHLQSGG